MRCVFGLLLAFASTATADAAPIFSDDFGSGNPDSLNWNGAPNWTVSGGTVDLIGNGPFGINLIPGNGNYVDLDGSSGQAGLFSTAMTFAPGAYLVQFSLAGNQRNSETDTVTVTLGSWSESFTFKQFDPFTTFSRMIVTSGGPLRFQNSAGVVANEGALLDNVSVTAAVPEPATLAVFGGLALVGAFGYRRRKASVTV